MAQLSDLPNEIILIILPLVLSDYIETFSGACRKHYSLAAEELKRHRTLKREHTLYKFPSLPFRGPTRLLDRILQEPRIALYVREITFTGWNSERATDPKFAFLVPYSEEISLRLEQAASEFVPKEKSRVWMTEIFHGNEDPIVSLLLILLPKLATLRLEGLGSERAELRYTLDRIARMKIPNAPLSLLHHVDLLCAWDMSGARIPRLFAALPSIRSIHVEQIGTHISFSNLSITEAAPQASKLEELTLFNCRVSLKSLKYILTGLKALRSFTFVATRYLNFDSTWFRDLLFAVAGSTLESLTLLTRDEKRNVIEDLRIFKYLRNLHVETQILLDYFPIGFDEASLAKALPPNLQTLTLECSGQGDEFVIGKYISKLAQMKKELLPQLQEVDVSLRNGTKDFNKPPDGAPFAITEGHSYEALVKACDAQGFKFHVTTLTVGVTRDLTGHPALNTWLDDVGLPQH